MKTTHPAAHPGGADWKARWEALGKNSFLKQSQTAHPEKWQAFYDRVAGVWDRMAGGTPATGEAMARVIAGQGLLQADDSILELGCGPGNLSVALAGQGYRVTAMDLSAGMIRALEGKIRTRRLSGIRPLVGDWKCLGPKPGHDLVLAAFFPEACCPDGILRMERLTRNACALVLADGTETFPLRRQIWNRVMDAPCPGAGGHLAGARNFLEQTGRHPKTYHLSCPASMNIECHLAEEYFQAYFGMFGRSGPHLDQAIADVFSRHASNNRLCLEGNASFGIVFWSALHPFPEHRSDG